MSTESQYTTAFLQRMENAPSSFTPSHNVYVSMRNGILIGIPGITISITLFLGSKALKIINNIRVLDQLTSCLGLKNGGCEYVYSTSFYPLFK